MIRDLHCLWNGLSGSVKRLDDETADMLNALDEYSHALSCLASLATGASSRLPSQVAVLLSRDRSIASIRYLPADICFRGVKGISGQEGWRCPE